MISESLAALSAGDNISEQRSYNMMMEILDGTTSDEQNTQMLNAYAQRGRLMMRYLECCVLCGKLLFQ